MDKIKKSRISVTITEPYIEALDELVKNGIYLSRGEAILEALRFLLRREKMEPFYRETNEPDE